MHCEVFSNIENGSVLGENIQKNNVQQCHSWSRIFFYGIE